MAEETFKQSFVMICIVPEGRRRLAGGVSHRNVGKRAEPRQGRRIAKDERRPSRPTPLPGLAANLNGSGGSRRRLISGVPPGLQTAYKSSPL